MKIINCIFTDEEHKEINKRKKESKLNWHDFILSLGKKNNQNERKKYERKKYERKK